VTAPGSHGAYHRPIAIAPEHRLGGFDCGVAALNAWLTRHALRNEGRSARTYVVLTAAAETVAYHTLATGSVALTGIARKYRHDMPNPVPVMVLGRLAVDVRHHGVGLGSALLREAIQRTLSISKSAGVRMLLVHAIDDSAAVFYRRFGFHEFPTGSRTLFLPVETMAAALETDAQLA
jgi:predicted N-acetyltransferase YhbS